MISQPGGRKISDISDFWPSFSYFHIFQSDRNASFFRFVISEGVGYDEKIIVLVVKVKANHKVLNGYSKNSYWIDEAERRKEGILKLRTLALFPPEPPHSPFWDWSTKIKGFLIVQVPRPINSWILINTSQVIFINEFLDNG